MNRIENYIPPTINIIAVTWSIIGIELALICMRISGIYTIRSIGQLIPFIIGATGLMKILYEIFLRYCHGSPLVNISRPLTAKVDGVILTVTDQRWGIYTD